MAVSKKNIETQLARLEEVVAKLESGDLSLDEGLKKFEEGIEIYKFCKDELVNNEKKIKVLTESLKEIDY